MLKSIMIFCETYGELCIRHQLQRYERQFQLPRRSMIYMNLNVRKPTFRQHVQSVNILLRLREDRLVENAMLRHFGIAKDAKFLHADKEHSDQTANMRKLI